MGGTVQLPITQDIVDALKTLDHNVPDGLLARIAAVTPAAGGFVLKLSEDEAMALAELVQWQIMDDPATGKPSAVSAPFKELIRLIDEAQFG